MIQKEKNNEKPKHSSVEASLGFSYVVFDNLMAFVRGLLLASAVLVAGVLAYLVATTPSFFMQPQLWLVLVMTVGTIFYLLYVARQLSRLQQRLSELRRESPSKPPERWWTRRD